MSDLMHTVRQYRRALDAYTDTRDRANSARGWHRIRAELDLIAAAAALAAAYRDIEHRFGPLAAHRVTIFA